MATFRRPPDQFANQPYRTIRQISTDPRRDLTVLPSGGGVTVVTATKLLAILPGEVFVNGVGKIGSPNPAIAGTTFQISIYAVDNNNTIATTNTDFTSLVSSDLYTVIFSPQLMLGGVQIYNVTPAVAGLTNFVVTDLTTGAIAAYTTPNVSVSAGPFVKLQALMPGETRVPGSASGRLNAPSPEISGTPVSFTVTACDLYWNLVTTPTDMIAITSTDGSATLPSNALLVNGAKTFNVTFNTVGSFTIRATDITDVSKLLSDSGSTTVNPGSEVSRNVALASAGCTVVASSSLGAGYPANATNNADLTGATYGSGGAWVSSAATVPQNIEYDFDTTYTINEIDVFNLQDAYASPTTPTLAMVGTLYQMSAFKAQYFFQGVWTDIPTASVTSNHNVWVQFQFTPITTNKIRIVISTAAPSGGYSGLTEVQAWTGSGSPFTTLRLTVPGGSKTAGTPFNVTVDAVDFAGNVVTSVTDIVAITSNDVYAVLPANAALVAGTGTLAVTLKVASTTTTITASDVTRPVKTPSTSGSITVNAASASALQLLLPGESNLPGSATGKTGSPSPQPTNTLFTPTVNAVDAYGNIVSNTHTVGITSSDGGATLPSNHALVAGAWAFTNGFKFAAVNGTAETITATDITTGLTPQTVNITCGTTSVITINDLTYLGMMGMPPTGAYQRDQGYGALTGRIVNGQVRLFTLGKGIGLVGIPNAAVGSIYEITPPAVLATTYTQATAAGSRATYQATLVNEWGFAPYGSGIIGNSSNAPVVRGLLFYNNKLFFAWGSAYDTKDYDVCVGFAILGADGSASATAYGPFNTTQGAIYSGGFLCKIPDAIAAYTGPIGYAGIFSGAGNEGTISGVTLEGGTEPTISTTTDTTGQDISLAHITATQLAHWPALTPMPITPGTVSRAICGYNTPGTPPCSDGFFGPHAVDGFFGPGDLTAGNPDTQRAAFSIDIITSTVFVKTSKVQGFLAFGQLVNAFSGINGVDAIDYGTDNKPHVWYSGNASCCHGQHDGLNHTITGPHAASALRYVFIFDQAKILQVANGSISHTALTYESINRIDTIAPTTAIWPRELRQTGGFRGAWFDEINMKLYLCEALVDDITSTPLIHVWSARNT